MNAFSPLNIELSSSPSLLLLYLLTYLLGSFALSLLSLSFEQILLAWLVYSGLLALLLWRDISIPEHDRIHTLYWDVEHGLMSVRTGRGDWVEITALCQAWSMPGIAQILLLQRADRYGHTRLVITPDRLSSVDSRRLHVALTWAPPLELRPAKENLSE